MLWYVIAGEQFSDRGAEPHARVGADQAEAVFTAQDDRPSTEVYQ